jgi:hypothetical protein
VRHCLDCNVFLRPMLMKMAAPKMRRPAELTNTFPETGPR